MRAVYRTLSSNHGETLLETLLSLLVVSLACVVFTTMTLVSSTINENAKIADAKLYAELSAAETHREDIPKTVTVSWHWQTQNYTQDFAVKATGTTGKLMNYSPIRGED